MKYMRAKHQELASLKDIYGCIGGMKKDYVYSARKVSLTEVDNLFGEARKESDWERQGFKNLVRSISEEGLWYPFICVRLDPKLLEDPERIRDYDVKQIYKKVKRFEEASDNYRKVDLDKPLLWAGTQRYEALQREGYTHTDIFEVPIGSEFDAVGLEKHLLSLSGYRFT